MSRGVVLAPEEVSRITLQRRVIRTLIGSQILGGVGMAAGIAVGALLAEELSGTEALAGVGTTAQVLGTALITIPVARATATRGRRIGLRLGLSLACVGAGVVLAAAVVGSFPLFVVGMFLFGGGTTANNQARYAAADLAEPARRGRDLSIVVWATTLGSVAGPNLVGPGKAVAGVLGLPEVSGTFVFALVGFVLAWLVVHRLLRPDPLLTARLLDAKALGSARAADASDQAGMTGVAAALSVPVSSAVSPVPTVPPGLSGLDALHPGAVGVADVPNHDGSMGRGLAVVRANPRALQAVLVMALGHLVMVASWS